MLHVGANCTRCTYPHILIFDVATIGPLIHFHSEDIDLTLSYHITYIKLCRVSATLTISNHFTVDPEMIGTVHSLEPKAVQNIVPPMVRNKELGFV